ncbi:MAG: class I SAM-dependent methyltransferase [Nanoarchaeota archaeon]
MKIRESGMPTEEIWETFFKPSKVLKTLNLDRETNDVVDFGCGYGTFTIPVAKIVGGKVYAIDIEPEMVEETKRKVRENRLNNVETILRDFVSSGSGLKNGSVDYVMLFNILHAKEPEKLLREAYRILRNGGKLGIIHWNYDSATPRGPPMEIRPKPEQCINWATNSGFNSPKRYNLKLYHYGIVMEKRK